MSTVRPVKTPTHLTITTDSVYGDSIINNGLHESDACIYDSKDRSHSATISQFGLTAPDEGAYIITQQPVSTHPLYIHVKKPSSVRLIPEEVDGSNADNACLPSAAACLGGCGVLIDVDPGRKYGYVVGRTSLGAHLGLRTFKVKVIFEDNTRWALWILPPPRSLVSFDGILGGISEEDTPEINLRRITSIAPASSDLLQSLGIGEEASGGRAARIRELRAAGARRQQNNVGNNVNATSPQIPAPPPTLPQQPSASKEAIVAGSQIQVPSQTGSEHLPANKEAIVVGTPTPVPATTSSEQPPASKEAIVVGTQTPAPPITSSQQPPAAPRVTRHGALANRAGSPSSPSPVPGARKGIKHNL
ncbi:hypothetical protein CF326_g753 [Tilletia indica]|nr:hypothetical protein CF326_g753 [Tilletia indica]